LHWPSRTFLSRRVDDGTVTARSSRERIPVEIFEDHDALAVSVGARIAEIIRERASEGRDAVLGLATGSTPLGVYRELIRLRREEDLDFSNVVTFNLDEYFPMDPGSRHSYHRFMYENLFGHVNIRPENVHVPAGNLSRDEVGEHCQEYERKIVDAGGIDYQLLGIGRSGHVGFNEPGSGVDSRTRLIYLDSVTRTDAAGAFFGEDAVPSEAITVGVATILDAREIALLATGEHKAAIVRRAVEGKPHPDVAATYLQDHPNATVLLDPPAASELTRSRAPWLIETVRWDSTRIAEAVIWLSHQTAKPLLHLATDDYREHHLGSLIARHGSAGVLNGKVFTDLLAKIRGKSKLPRSCSILVFSPHPDDDVISMGGLLRKLAENGNRITVAYQTSGNIAVFDHEVRRYLDFVSRAAEAVGLGNPATVRRTSAKILARLEGKLPGELDAPEVRHLKRVVRETEAVAALEATGLNASCARFLDLPFYRTGQVRKRPLGDVDVEIVLSQLEESQPDIVCAAGDLSDPHGTHRMCLEAVERALALYKGAAPELWLYRGAWQEWSLTEATTLVPLSDSELHLKTQAIFRHESQKDNAPFPGPDPREFWQRVVDRNRGTAEDLRTLGLPAYYAMETYRVITP